MQVLKRGVKIKGKTVYDIETVFIPPSFIDQYRWIRKQSKRLLGMHSISGSDSLKSQWKRKGSRPASTHSNGHRLTYLIRFCGRTVLLGETCSQRHCFFLYLNCQKESTSLNATRHEIYRNMRNPPPLKSLPQPTRTWHCTCREPICKCCHGRWRTRLILQMCNWLIMDGKLTGTWASDACHFSGATCTIETYRQVQLQSGGQSL